ncbi:MAG: cupin domain-containing protein [Deltaproteobacteria bacterium]|nr:cupin domain-containing protein [Deltaproteobacteria bacterium]MBW2596370.1 cupin domain-containing protein [Deltaproteobacteria bacterium]MBW2650279.1 cupin domain-containing protein [Deltaproteobacteria bacterium]
MIIHHYEDVEAVEMMKGVKKRVVIGDREGAPNFIMRIIELEPGASSPLHDHPWEHEIFVLKGEATARNSAGDENPVGEGDAVFIPPGEEHRLTNKGEGVVRFMCLIPTGVE